MTEARGCDAGKQDRHSASYHPAVSVVKVAAEIVFGGAVLLAPWGFLIERRNPVAMGGRWALAVAVIPSLVLGLIVISLVMLPLWFIPILGWAVCFRVIAAYMRP